MIRLIVLLSVFLVSATVHAAPKVKANPQVKGLYRAGAQAYDKGKFEAAIEAFEAAYDIQELPQLLFSAAAAHRRQYAADGDIEHLRTALSYYRLYLKKVSDGGRRVDAAKAVESLQSKVGEEDGEAKAKAKAKATRLIITTVTKTATISIDGKQAVPMPFVERVKPGRHKLLIKAPGYKDNAREVVAMAGAVVAIEVPLEELPAKLMVQSTRGGELLVDGAARGSLPLTAPVELPAGTRNLVILSRGAEAYAQSVALRRGETLSVDVAPRRTKQRTVSYAVMGTSVAGLIAGGVLGGLAYKKQSKAQGILDARESGTQRTDADRVDYNEAIAARDDLRMGATVALGSAAVVGITGLLMYIFDVPVAPMNSPVIDAPSTDEEPEADAPTVELSATGFGLRF